MANEQIFFKENMNRSIRRHHYQRLKKKRQHYWQWPTDNQVLTGASLGICTNTPANCSDMCCGNPRRHFGEITIQEKRQEKIWLTNR